MRNGVMCPNGVICQLSNRNRNRNVSVLNSQSVLRNDITSYALARWVWYLFGVEFVFFFIVLCLGRIATGLLCDISVIDIPSWTTIICHPLCHFLIIHLHCKTWIHRYCWFLCNVVKRYTLLDIGTVSMIPRDDLARTSGSKQDQHGLALRA